MPQNPYPFRRSPGGWRRKPPRSPLTSARSGALPVLPAPTLVGINNITSTTAQIIAAVNPNSYDTTWWIAYSTSLPLSAGGTTSPLDIGSGSIPITLTSVLTGLDPVTTYYVSVVAQSASGTVYSQTVSFTTLATQTVTSTVLPATPSPVTVPHFGFPFTLVSNFSSTLTGAGVVEQDTVEEIVSNVGVIMACPVGACSQLPNFGGPNYTFSMAPLDTSTAETAIQLWEPRATEDIVSQLLPDGSSWGLSLMTSATADQDT